MSSTPQQSQDISIPDLRSKLNGEVIGPNDAAYDEARQVIFKGVDRRPAAVALPPPSPGNRRMATRSPSTSRATAASSARTR